MKCLKVSNVINKMIPKRKMLLDQVEICLRMSKWNNNNKRQKEREIERRDMTIICVFFFKLE
jgi:hypothetical protein